MNYEQQVAKHSEPTAHEWFQTFSDFWVVGIVPIILAWFAWKSVVAQTRKHNEYRREKYKSLNKDQDFKEDTVLQYMRKKIKDES